VFYDKDNNIFFNSGLLPTTIHSRVNTVQDRPAIIQGPSTDLQSTGSKLCLHQSSGHAILSDGQPLVIECFQLPRLCHVNKKRGFVYHFSVLKKKQRKTVLFHYFWKV